MNQPQNIDVQAIFTEIVEQRNQALNSAAEARAYVRTLEAQIAKLTSEMAAIKKPVSTEAA